MWTVGLIGIRRRPATPPLPHDHAYLFETATKNGVEILMVEVTKVGPPPLPPGLIG
jgi:hypothetical protein